MPVSSKLCCSFAVAALITFAPADFAQQQPEPADTQVSEPDDQTVSETGVNSHIIVYGAARDRSNPTEAVVEDESVPELPVVYEDDADAAKVTAPAAAAPPASPAR